MYIVALFPIVLPCPYSDGDIPLKAIDDRQGIRPSEGDSRFCRIYQRMQPNGISSFNNQGVGPQYNNERGNQNVVAEGILITGSIFNGDATFNSIKDERPSKISLASRISLVLASNSDSPQLQPLKSFVIGSKLISKPRRPTIPFAGKSTTHIVRFSIIRNLIVGDRNLPYVQHGYGYAGFSAAWKIVVGARISRYIKDEKKEAIAHYFFSSEFKNQRDPMAAIRSWVYRMARINQSVLGLVNTKRKQNANEKTSDAAII